MGFKKTFTRQITRRDFLKNMGKGALALGAGLESIVACAPALKETPTPEEMADKAENIQWECNPIIPMIPGKIYTGTNSRIAIDIQKEWWEKNYGISMAFHKPTWSADDAISDMFPKEECEREIKYGAIPFVNWVLKPFDGFRPIAKGKFDDTVKRFAHQLAEFGHPIVLLPWQCANEPSRRIWPWSGPSPGQYKEAWIRMHNIFQKEGANKNVVWSTKLISGRWAYETMYDPIPYIPPKEYVDIIG